MTWLRYDDRFTAAPSWDRVSHAARWHYMALVEACGATARWDGVLPLTLARRASDVPDPDAALRELERAGRVAVGDDEVRVMTVHDHLPPPHLRDAEQARVRQRRSRAHRAGDHSMCLPENCDHVTPDVTPDVTRDVTRNTGTGRDRTLDKAITTQAQPLEHSRTASRRGDVEVDIEAVEADYLGKRNGPYFLGRRLRDLEWTEDQTEDRYVAGDADRDLGACVLKGWRDRDREIEEATG